MSTTPNEKAPALAGGTGRNRELSESSGSAAEPTSPFDRAAFVEFYRRREAEGPVVVAHRSATGGAMNARSFATAEQAADFAEKLCRRGRHVYVVNNAPPAGWAPPNLNDDRDGGDPPDADEIEHRCRLQVDLDPAKGADPDAAKAAMHRAVDEVFADLRSAAVALPEEKRPPGRIGPTEVVDSGRGVHLHMELLGPAVSGEIATAANEALIHRFKNHPEAGKLWKPDGVGNVNRVMRAVGTRNPRTGTIVRLLHRDEESRASLALWRTVLGEVKAETLTARTEPETAHSTIDRRFNDKLRHYADRLTDAKRAQLAELAALDWDDIDKSATPESAGLSERATLQVMHGVAKVDDLTEDADGRPVPRAGLDRSAALEAAAGQMLREHVPIPTIAGILANPNLPISAHVYDGEKHKSASYRCRAVVRAIAEAVLTQEEEEDRPVLSGSPLEDARAFRDRAMPTLIHQRQDYLAYDAGAYRELEEETVRAKLYHFLEGCDQLDKKGNARPCVPTSRQVSMVLDALRAVAHVPAERYEPPCFLDGRTEPDPRELVSFPNGLLHLPSGELLPPTSQFFTRNALSFDYDPDAPEPAVWLRFLQEVWPGDDERDCIDALQDFMGYTLTPDTSMQKALLIVGRKRSGKGTIGRVWVELEGRHNTTSPTLNSLSRDFGLEPLLGKQLAIISDMRLGAKTDPAAVAESLLRITGEDAVTINRKYKAAITTTLPVRFVVLTNLLPKFSDTSGALASRFIVLPMQQSFYGREDRNLTRKLLAELPGILNWAIEGWRRVQARGYLTEPRAGREAIEHMVDLATPIPAFVRECCRVGPNATVDKGKLFHAFRTWHFERYGTEARYSSKEWFSRDLYAAVDGVRGTRTNTGDRLYTGIELIEEPPANPEDLF